MRVFEKSGDAGARVKFYLQKCLVGFSYGLSFPLTLVTLDYWLKDVGVSNSVIGLFTLLHWPFSLKFLWGIFVEHYDVPHLSKIFSRNRSWLVISHLFLMAGVLGMANSSPESGLTALIFWASLVALADGCRDVALYPYQISKISAERLGYVAGVVGLGHRIGAISIKVITLQTAHFFSWKAAYLTAAAMIFLLLIPVLFMEDPVTGGGDDSGKDGAFIWSSMRGALRSSLVIPLKTMLREVDGGRRLAVIILYKGADFMMQKMSRSFCLAVGFSKLEIANVVQLFGSVSVIIGGILGGYFVRRLGLIRSMMALGLIHMFSFLSYLLLLSRGNDLAILHVVILLEGLSGGGVTAVFLAFLYDICKTGGQYALLWAFHEFGGMLFMAASGIMADHLGWGAYFCLTPLIFLPNLPLLRRLGR
ncbi:MAG: MFS transporter [Holosporaceae bacterium]|jgi:PAT family beta-lactamase induction signal transducer AmpG|nr:MFS transporter [Holosporaceae bacterium]